MRHQRRNQLPEPLAVPVLKNGFAPCYVCSRRHGHPEPGAANQLNGRTSGSLDDREPIALPEVVVALSLYHLAFGLTVLPRELSSMFANPGKSSHDRHPYRIIIEAPRHSNTDPAIGRVDSDVKVLDFPPHDGDRDTSDEDHM